MGPIPQTADQADASKASLAHERHPSEHAGGTAVGVLADSLDRAASGAATRQELINGRLCLCTPYKPDARFSVGNATGRNKIIYGLSRATFAVATADGTGGTWSGATESIDKGYGRVAVWRGPGEGPGNERLERAGAVRITDCAQLLELEALPPEVVSGEQLSLLRARADDPAER